MKPRNYIGLAVTVHDPAIAIVNNSGEIVFAEGAERSAGVKRAWCCVPDEPNQIRDLIRKYCDPEADLVVARSWSFGMKTTLQSFFVSRPAVTAQNLLGSTFSSEDQRLGTGFMEEQARWLAYGLDASLRQSGKNLQFRAFFHDLLEENRGVKVIDRAYDHHLCHAASAAYTSPFDEALCAIIDGYGEKSATSFYRYDGRDLIHLGPKRKIGVPTSLGVFYLLLCVACGFDPYKGEEWKVMGLAAHGSFDKRFYDLLRPMFRVDGLSLIASRDEKRRIGELLGFRKQFLTDSMAARDLAFTGQQVFSEICAELLQNLHALSSGCENLVLGGGAALNSAFNGRVTELTPFRNLHVFSAPGDDGNAIGAALLAFREDHRKVSLGEGEKFQTPFLGSSLDSRVLRRLERFSGLPVEKISDDEAAKRAAQLLSEGKIIGWVRGRAEFGPRALGNRSILADPRRPDIQDVINGRVKFREGFRPFAPAILDEHCHEWFERPQFTPYMERTLVFRPEQREKVPGVVHADGTGRLQSVTRATNPEFYALIQAFFELTGVPIVLNTSFNVMGKPIAHSVEDALGVFFTTGLDALFIEGFCLSKAF